MPAKWYFKGKEHATTRANQFHFPFSICHFSFDTGQPMTNDKWKIENCFELLPLLCFTLSAQAVAIRIMQMHVLLSRHFNLTKAPADRRAVISYHPLKLEQLVELLEVRIERYKIAAAHERFAAGF